jgi:hypothetical protein
MAPIVSLSLGAITPSLPKAEDGITYAAAIADVINPVVFSRNFLRVIVFIIRNLQNQYCSLYPSCHAYYNIIICHITTIKIIHSMTNLKRKVIMVQAYNNITKNYNKEV